jgi:methionine sulfoxide reductase heme-binding subunit
MTAITFSRGDKTRRTIENIMRTIGLIVLVASLYLVVLVVVWLGQSHAIQPIGTVISGLFAMDTVQTWWYVTRAAGLTSYILLWLSMVWGMAIPTKILSPAVEGTYSYDFHEFVSLLGLGFVVLHVVVLLLDKFLPFTIWQVLIPFVDSYRPLWVGLGIIGFYLFLLVTATFYMRQALGPRAFRSIHMLSLVGYLGATLHGLFAGTDSALPVARLIYGGTFLVVVFLTAYWILLKVMNRPSGQVTVVATRTASGTHQRSSSRR